MEMRRTNEFVNSVVYNDWLNENWLLLTEERLLVALQGQQESFISSVYSFVDRPSTPSACISLTYVRISLAKPLNLRPPDTRCFLFQMVHFALVKGSFPCFSFTIYNVPVLSVIN